jgi:hypothetical protein
MKSAVAEGISVEDDELEAGVWGWRAEMIYLLWLAAVSILLIERRGTKRKSLTAVECDEE